MACPAPDPALGTAMRISSYLDCNAQMLGREGFLSLAQLGHSGGLLTALVTISIALIGYRLLLGDDVGLRNGAGWAFRVGVVLALLAGWSAFKVLFYDVAIAGPPELADRLLGAMGVPEANVAERIQAAYDTVRLGVALPEGYTAENAAALAGQFAFQPPMPRTATAFLLASVGLVGATRLAVAFLLAVAPFPIMALLFTPAYGLFVGWLRALATAVFGTIAACLVTGLELLAVEAEIARLQNGIGAANAAAADSQAIVAIVLIFALCGIGLLLASARLSGAITAAMPWAAASRPSERATSPGGQMVVAPSDRSTHERALASERIVTITDALNDVVRREKRSAGLLTGAVGSSSNPTQAVAAPHTPVGRTGMSRQALGRRHRSAMRRDGAA